MKKLGNVIYDSGYWTVMHDGIEHAGYLAFLGMLSLFPFLVFFIVVAGFIGEMPIGAQFFQQVQALLPEHVVAALRPRIEEIIAGPPEGLLTIAFVGVIWTASSAVEGTRTILNRAYRVETPPAYIWRRLMSIGQFMVLTFALIVAMLMLIFVPVLWAKLGHYFHWQEIADKNMGYVRYGISSLILLNVVVASYYILPNIKQRMLAVLPGALIVMVLWVLAAMLFSSYLQNFEQVNLIYGSLGGIIASLLFFYIMGVIYIFGAEFNYFFEKALGHKIVQKEKLSKKQLKEQRKAKAKKDQQEAVKSDNLVEKKS